MGTSGPTEKKYYVSYVVQPGKGWGHAALLLKSTKGARTTNSMLYDFFGTHPGATGHTTSKPFYPEDEQKVIKEYKTWEISETAFKALQSGLDDDVKTHQQEPLIFNPVTRNCKTFALKHLHQINDEMNKQQQPIPIPSEDLKELKNPFIPIPVRSGKLNKLSDVKSISESLGKLDSLIDAKLNNKSTLPAETEILQAYKTQLKHSTTAFEKINTSLPVEAETSIKNEFQKLQSATQKCQSALSQTKFIEPGIMNELKLLLDKLKEYFKPTLEGQMKKLPSPK